MNPMPSFANDFHRHQAEQLLQPVLIRVIDNLRKVVEASSWASTYEEQLLWPEGTTADEVAQVEQLAAQLEQADAAAASALQQQLSQLPMPFPATGCGSAGAIALSASTSGSCAIRFALAPTSLACRLRWI